MDAAELLRSNDLDAATAKLLEQVRGDPANAKLRVFLFQLCCVTGDWARAKTQLDVAVGMDPAAKMMGRMYGDALNGEETRRQVLSGEAAPTIFGDPQPWLAKLYEALRFDRKGEHDAASRLREQALDEAPTTAGAIDGKDFTWIADADSTLGPVLEVIMNGRYFWMPFFRLKSVAIEEPSDLRDQIWMPARLTFTNKGESVGLIPTRYFASEKNSDPLVRLARKTDWLPLGPDQFEGRGQRMFATNEGDFPLMDVRSIRLTHPEPEMPAHG